MNLHSLVAKMLLNLPHSLKMVTYHGEVVGWDCYSLKVIQMVASSAVNHFGLKIPW